MDSFQGLTSNSSHHGIDLWLQVEIFYDHVNPTTRRTIDQLAGGKLLYKNIEESWELLEDLALYENESWNDPMEFSKSVKAISLPQDVLNTFDRHLTELENQVQCLMEAYLAPKSPNEDIMFVEIIIKYDDSSEEELEEDGSTVTRELGVEYFDRFPTRSELAYHKYLMYAPIPSKFLRNSIIVGGCPSNPKKPCNLGHVHVEKAYIDFNFLINVMTHIQYNWIMRKQLEPREDPEGIVKFASGTNEITYKMPHKIDQFNSLSDLEKEQTKLIYFRNEVDEKRVEYMMNRILGFYKECLELGPEYLTGLEECE
nr:MAK10-like protein [Tanacetum cinerariifolium]